MNTFQSSSRLCFDGQKVKGQRTCHSFTVTCVTSVTRGVFQIFFVVLDSESSFWSLMMWFRSLCRSRSGHRSAFESVFIKCVRKRASVLCWRASGKKEPGSSAHLHQPFYERRTPAVFLFGWAWLYEFIMPLRERSSKNQPPNPRAPLPTHQLGLHLLFWPFLCGGVTSKWILDGSLCLETEVSSSQCERQTAGLRAVLLSEKKKDGVWVHVIKMRIN